VYAQGNVLAKFQIQLELITNERIRDARMRYMSEMSSWMHAVAKLGYMVILAGIALFFVGAMLGSEYANYPRSNIGLIGRDWGMPMVLIGLALIGIGVALALPDIRQRK